MDERVVEVKTTLRPKDVKAFLGKLDQFKGKSGTHHDLPSSHADMPSKGLGALTTQAMLLSHKRERSLKNSIG